MIEKSKTKGKKTFQSKPPEGFTIEGCFLVLTQNTSRYMLVRNFEERIPLGSCYPLWKKNLPFVCIDAFVLKINRTVF